MLMDHETIQLLLILLILIEIKKSPPECPNSTVISL